MFVNYKTQKQALHLLNTSINYLKFDDLNR